MIDTALNLSTLIGVALLIILSLFGSYSYISYRVRQLRQELDTIRARHLTTLSNGQGTVAPSSPSLSPSPSSLIPTTSLLSPNFNLSTVTIEVESLSSDGTTYHNQRGVAEVLTIQDDSRSSSTSRPLFLIIPGNPGLVQFYQLFMIYLNRLCEGKVEVRRKEQM